MTTATTEPVAGSGNTAATKPAYEFPSSFWSSFSYWLRSFKGSTGLKAEEAIVQRGLEGSGIPLVQASEISSVKQGPRAVLHTVPLDGIEKDSKRWMRVLEIGDAHKSENEHVVFLTHGYGNGLGFYFQQYAALAKLQNTRCYYLDWLGMGCSGRPNFPKIEAGGPTETAAKKRVTQAEEWFTTSLDDCRRKLNVSKIHTLCGHSIGGYLSASYALRFPRQVGKLLLISPVGVPTAPWNTYEFNDDDVESRAKAQYEQNQQAAAALEEQMVPAGDVQAERESSPPSPAVGTPASRPSSSQSSLPERDQQSRRSNERVRRTEPPTGWWVTLWEKNVSPFSILRGATFMGPSLISRYASRRFAAFPDGTKQDLFAYLYNISVDRGSGEYILAHVLAPGAFARWPLSTRLGRLDLPITFIYGDSDWMDDSYGREALAKVLAKPQTAANELQRARSKVLINDYSGHWVHLENPQGFNSLIMKELRDSIHDQAVA